MALYSYDYDTTISPSASVIPVEVQGSNEQVQQIVAMVDSGADATMLPIALLEAVAAEEVETRYLRTVTGRRTIVDLYRVTLTIGPFRLPAIRAIAIDAQMEAVIGRDVLNHLVVTLNGLAGVTEISD